MPHVNIQLEDNKQYISNTPCKGSIFTGTGENSNVFNTLDFGIHFKKVNVLSVLSAMEAVKILKILQSSKAPLIKKRQAMRNAFGDYRTQMRKERAKSAAG